MESTRPEFNFIGNEGHYVAPFKMGHFVEQESAAMEEISTERETQSRQVGSIKTSRRPNTDTCTKPPPTAQPRRPTSC